MLSGDSALGLLTGRVAHSGLVAWIGVRPERRVPMQAVVTADLDANGLIGDRRATPGKRAVTLIQHEHLAVISAFAGAEVSWEALRRNIVVAGINLLALRKAEFRVGSALLRGTGICAPCSRMEEAFGPGGYNAVRGHGGITAEVLEAGQIALGDAVTLPQVT